MSLSDLETRLTELERRVRELERRSLDIVYPAPYWQVGPLWSGTVPTWTGTTAVLFERVMDGERLQ